MYAIPPADTFAFFWDTAQTLGFVPRQAHAQGIGFSGLAALLPIWKAFRNIAYALLAIVMIAIGFMVMFRKKIDPKTVVTVQNALPRIVVTMLLITFSYAIVAIMIDFMYFLMFLGFAVLNSTGFMPPLPSAAGIGQAFSSPGTLFATGGLSQVFSGLFPFGWFSKADLIWDIFGGGAAIGVSVISGAAGLLVGGPVGAVVGAVTPSVLAVFLLDLALLFLFIRLFIMFLNAYIQIILALLIGPVQIMLDAVPGSNTFSAWFKNLLSHMITFPVAGLMFMLAYMFSAVADTTQGSIWSPPFLALFSTPTSRTIAALFSLGILMSIPSTVSGIKEALKAKAPIAGPGAITGVFGNVMGTATSSASLFFYGSQIFKGLRPGKEGQPPAGH
jgi:hypothetical protein